MRLADRVAPRRSLHRRARRAARPGMDVGDWRRCKEGEIVESAGWGRAAIS
jgi:hypothetical protein